jgi:hypothetical protein
MSNVKRTEPYEKEAKKSPKQAVKEWRVVYEEKRRGKGKICKQRRAVNVLCAMG